MILLIDNYDSFSYNLYQLIGEIEPDIRVIRNDEMTVEEIRALKPDRIILSPGPGRPEDAGVIIAVAKELGKEIPILGVCLGHQAICAAYGATLNVESKKKFSVSMQHYSFAVKAFVQLAKEVGMDEYEFAVHETKTKEVIDNVKNLKSELGVLFLSDFNEKVLRKLFKECDIEFKELFTCNTYVYLWKKHPLAGKKVITLDDLQEYPCLTFEQGVNNSFYYAEEMMSTYEYKRVIKADDRATMLNLMVGLNGFTLCSGIISEDLNGDDYAAIPLKESEIMHIGYIKHKGTKLSKLGEIYIDSLKNYENKVL